MLAMDGHVVGIRGEPFCRLGDLVAGAMEIIPEAAFLGVRAWASRSPGARLRSRAGRCCGGAEPKPPGSPGPPPIPASRAPGRAPGRAPLYRCPSPPKGQKGDLPRDPGKLRGPGSRGSCFEEAEQILSPGLQSGLRPGPRGRASTDPERPAAAAGAPLRESDERSTPRHRRS